MTYNLSKHTVTFAVMLAILAGGVATVYAAPYKSERMQSQYLRSGSSMHLRSHSVRVAVEERDYERWLLLTSGAPIRRIITTREQFDRLADAHDLLESGKVAEAHEIMRELGMDEMLSSHLRGGMRLYLELTDEQVEILERARVAYQAGDHVQARELISEVRERVPLRIEENRTRGWGRTALTVE